jgi:DNA sulfur modification protein DndE
MVSLEDGPIRGTPVPDENGSEFNAYTLTGEYSALFSAFLRWREEGQTPEKPLSNEELLRLLRTHISRGIGTLSVRVKSPLDLLQLVPQEA